MFRAEGKTETLACQSELMPTGRILRVPTPGSRLPDEGGRWVFSSVFS